MLLKLFSGLVMCQGHLSKNTIIDVHSLKSNFFSCRNTSFFTTLFFIVITQSRNFLKRKGHFLIIANSFRNSQNDTILLLKLNAVSYLSGWTASSTSPHPQTTFFLKNKNFNDIFHSKLFFNFCYCCRKSWQRFYSKTFKYRQGTETFSASWIAFVNDASLLAWNSTCYKLGEVHGYIQGLLFLIWKNS